MYDQNSKTAFTLSENDMQLSTTTLGSVSRYYYIPAALYYGI